MALKRSAVRKIISALPPLQENPWLTQYEQQYRNNTQSRRQNRGLADHDIFEGLPVRNWRRDIVVVAPPPAHNTLNQQADKWDVELPWGMPKDAHLMPQHSQDLLRAARSGRIYQKRPLMEDENEDDTLMADKPEKKEVEQKDDGFTVKTWKLVPKHLEGPEFEYLAKRRKGLKGAVVKTGAAGPTMTKMTVRKTDDQGNSFIEHVVVAEGQAVEGEVIAQTVVTDVAAVSAVAEPLRRRPPPPKRKAKGPGRGRKKKIMMTAPTGAPSDAGSIPVEGQAPAVPKAEGAVGPDRVKQESTVPPSADNEDTPMADGSLAASDDEDESGSEDGSEEGEIVDEDQEQEDEEEKARALERERERERLIKANHSVMEHKLPAKPAITGFGMDSPGGPFANQRPSLSRDLSGSPLKNEVAPRSYSPSVHNPEDEAEGEEDEDEEPHNGRRSHRSTPYVSRPPSEPSFEPQHQAEILSNTASNVEEKNHAEDNGGAGFQDMLEDASPHGTDMLLDGGGSSQDTVLAQPIDDANTELPSEQPEMDRQDLDQDQVMGNMDMEEGENFEDLLGGLEEHLNEHEAAASGSLLSRSDDVPQKVTVPDGDKEGLEEVGREEQKPVQEADVDRMTPVQVAAEAPVDAATPEFEKQKKAEAIPAEPEALTEVPPQKSVEPEQTAVEAAVVGPAPSAEEKQVVEGDNEEPKESASTTEKDKENVAKDGADVDA